MKIFYMTTVSVLVAVLAFGVSGVALAATAIPLGTAGSFAVLGASTVTNTGSTIINGDLGLSPGTSVTGFPPGMVNGTQQVTDAVAAQAQADLVTAYDAASGQSTGVTTVSGDLGGQTLVPGLYKSPSSLGLTGTLTLDGQGSADAVFVFQLGSALTTASASRVNLINGAQACNVFWQIGSSATLGTNSNFSGTILALASVTVNTGASVDGRVLARTGAVTLDTNPISKPTCAAPVVPLAPVTPTPVPTPTSTPVAPVLTPVVPVVPTTTAPVVVTPISILAPAPVAFIPLSETPYTGYGLADELLWDLINLGIPSAFFAAVITLYLFRRREQQ